MTRTKLVERLLRVLITMLGAALGAGLAAIALPILSTQIYHSGVVPFKLTVILYLALIVLGAIVFFLFSRVLTAWLLKQSAAVMRRWDEMPGQQILLATIGMVLGLLIAALLTQLLLSAGSTFLTITFSAIVYVLLGYTGLQMGYRKYRSFGRMEQKLRKRFRRHPEALITGEELPDELDGDDIEDAATTAMPKVLDSSALIDGRIYDVAKTGFLEGELVAPVFVMTELQHIADSADDLKRARGRRGLDVLGRLGKLQGVQLTLDPTDYDDPQEVDVKLLKLAKERGGAVVTNDYNLGKVAAVAGIRVLNINDLANAVKPMLVAGEELTVQIVKEGKEQGQGVSYLDDGTMIVVEGGRAYVGQSKPVVVTTVLQTSAGRMIFVKLKD